VDVESDGHDGPKYVPAYLELGEVPPEPWDALDDFASGLQPRMVGPGVLQRGVARALHQRDLTLEHLVRRVDEVLESNETRKVLENINEKEHIGDGLKRTIETLAEYLD